MGDQLLAQQPVGWGSSPALSALQRVNWPRMFIPQAPSGGLKEHGAKVMAVGFSADDRHFASSDRSGLLVLWDTARWTVIKRLPGFMPDPAFNAYLTLSPGGRLLYTYNQVFSTQTGAKVADIEQGGRAVFSPDGRLLVGGTPLKFWEAGSWKQVWEDRPEEFPSTSLIRTADVEKFQFSRDGKILLTQRRGGVVQAMDTHTFKTVFDRRGDNARSPAILTLPTPHPAPLGDYVIAVMTDWRGKSFEYYDMKSNTMLGRSAFAGSWTMSSFFHLPRFQHWGLALGVLTQQRAGVWNPQGVGEMTMGSQWIGPPAFSSTGFLIAWASDYDIRFALLAQPGTLARYRK